MKCWNIGWLLLKKIMLTGLMSRTHHAYLFSFSYLNVKISQYGFWEAPILADSVHLKFRVNYKYKQAKTEMIWEMPSLKCSGLWQYPVWVLSFNYPAKWKQNTIFSLLLRAVVMSTISLNPEIRYWKIIKISLVYLTLKSSVSQWTSLLSNH